MKLNLTKTILFISMNFAFFNQAIAIETQTTPSFIECKYAHQEPGMSGPEDIYTLTLNGNVACPDFPSQIHGVQHNVKYSHSIGNKDYYISTTPDNEKCLGFLDKKYHYNTVIW